jgi:hypothetical protein
MLKKPQDIILHFRGQLNYDIIGELIGSLKDNMKLRHARFGLYKKILTLLIESLENIVRYYLEISHRKQLFRDNPPEIKIEAVDEFYFLEASNVIRNHDIPPLEKKMTDLNHYSKDKIKELYKSTITDGKFSEKGGAGLGIIEMAKIVDKDIEYQFTPLNDEFSIFKIRLIIKQSDDKLNQD